MFKNMEISSRQKKYLLGFLAATVLAAVLAIIFLVTSDGSFRVCEDCGKLSFCHEYRTYLISQTWRCNKCAKEYSKLKNPLLLFWELGTEVKKEFDEAYDAYDKALKYDEALKEASDAIDKANKALKYDEALKKEALKKSGN